MSGAEEAAFREAVAAADREFIEAELWGEPDPDHEVIGLRAFWGPGPLGPESSG